MRYLPHTDADIQTMLGEIGIQDFEELFQTVPEACRYDRKMNLPDPKTEWELNTYMGGIRSMMDVTPDHTVLIGAGRYQHHIPSTIPSIMGRSEFLTAYTPYQPEMAQGTLQGLFEYQTLTARLLGVDVANASMYDGASAAAEAALMAMRLTRRSKVVVAHGLHPHSLAVLRTYLSGLGAEISQADLDYITGRIGDFGGDNRAGIERTLHRISAFRNRQGKIIGRRKSGCTAVSQHAVTAAIKRARFMALMPYVDQ